MAYVGPAQRWQGVYCHEHWEPVGYHLLSSSYNYTVRDVFVEALLTETYEAQTNVDRECSYIFEIPPEASVIGFSAQVGDIKIDGIVDEKAEADKKYQKAMKDGVQAWKLDKINEGATLTKTLEHLTWRERTASKQIEIYLMGTNWMVPVSVTYVYVISSDTIEDSIRLTIPIGLADRPGAQPASQKTVPTAPTDKNAVTITVAIEAQEEAQIFDLGSLSHHANIIPGFSDASYQSMTTTEKKKAWKSWKAYVEFTSKSFLKNHFILVWTVDLVDQGRCIVEKLSPPIPGNPTTYALALTLVSNIDLSPEEHEYIFLIDHSGSMSGARSLTANNVVRTMLERLPKVKRSSFNIYYFNTTAWSIVPGGKSLGYDINNVANAVSQLNTNASGSTDINTALTTVLNQREASNPRCSIIVVTDGLDWGVTAAMQTIQRNVTATAAQSRLLRVFVMGLGDDVSRGMCEGLARAGSGATAYSGESQLQERDHELKKAQTLIDAIDRAPILVQDVKWGMIGDNLDPPKSIQQAPLPGTLFWAVRSYWYAIINGTFNDVKATIKYQIPGSAKPNHTITVEYGDEIKNGRLIHALAARALIQTYEDKALSITDATEKYYNEAEIVRLGKTYSLASTQTSFVATTNGVGTTTHVTSNIPPDGSSLLASVSLSNKSSLDFVRTQAPTTSTAQASFTARGQSGISTFTAPRTNLATDSSVANQFLAMRSAPSVGSDEPSGFAAAQDGSGAFESNAGSDELSGLATAQDGNGAFNLRAVQQIVFPDTSIPAVPPFILVLEGRDNLKEQMWLAICVVAFFKKKHAAHSTEWSDTQAKAEKFVKTTLCCIFGVDSGRAEEIYTKSLGEAENHF
ncbi:von Willebrand domain protein [Xylaria flabelliformis]|nr:von Willebrand domain protein [Xylaria flabelliformis]